jgi:GT2 family glycosyltransferase
MKTLFSASGDEVTVPEVTVVVPVYNYAHYVVETLDSVRKQTIKDLDLIVVDDCSTDDSASVITAWMEEHGKRFRKATLFRQDKNSGLGAVRNQAFENAETKFVFPLDADNVIYPSCMEKLARALAASRCAFAYCILERFCQDIGQRGFPLMNLRQWDPSALGNGNYIDAMALIRKDAWRMAGKYEESLRLGWEDYELWLNIARCNGGGVHVPQILGRYRVHRSSMLNKVSNTTASQKKLSKYLRETYPEFFAK